MANDIPAHGAPTENAKPRNAVANTFIVVGFLLLIFLGIAIAIYSSRYVPMAVNTFSSNNAITGLPAGNQNSLAVEPGQSIPFNNEQTATSTTMTTTSFPTTGPAYETLPNGYQPTPAADQTANGQPASAEGAYSAAAHSYGLPDLAVNIVAVGYLANASNASFVATPVVPVGARAAVQFTIGNLGAAPTGPWAFNAEIPTDNGYLYQSPIEASMNPGDHVLFTLAFDQVPEGSAEMINIIADPNNYIQEITKSNNEAQASVAVVGS
jgi:hypothetical protein